MNATADTARREGVNGAARWCESCHGFLGYVGGKDLPRPYRCKLCAIIAEKDAEIAALRDVVSLQGSALREIRIRLHAAGRRPEECYEMSILDDTIAASRRALEETP